MSDDELLDKLREACNRNTRVLQDVLKRLQSVEARLEAIEKQAAAAAKARNPFGYPGIFQ